MAELTDQDIVVYRGEAVTLPFTMSPVVNISGWTLKFTVTKAANKTTKLLGPLSMTVTSGAAGTFSITLAEEQLNFTPGAYRFDVWRTDEGLEQPIAIGNFTLVGNSRVPPIE